ncbi:MAG: thioredoxin, partial [Planctomycetota bacterium]
MRQFGRKYLVCRVAGWIRLVELPIDSLGSFSQKDLESMTRRQKFFRHLSWVTAVSAGLLGAPSALAAPTVLQALKLAPVQADVEYQRVPAGEEGQCKLRDIERDDWAGWEVVSPDGELLRRFADTNGDSKVDLWCYFRFGVEVYRDIDSDFNGKADQYRWLGTAGIRWGIDRDEDMAIEQWKQISAEEVSSELVAAIREADAERFVALLASEKELRQVGLGRGKARQLAEKALMAAKRFSPLSKSQKAVGKDAKWLQFTAGAPGVVPEGTEGATQDVIVYENAVAMFSDGDTDEGATSGQLMIGSMVKVGQGWRLVDLPSLTADGQAIEQTAGNFFQSSGPDETAVGSAVASGPAMQKMVTALEAIDSKLGSETDEKSIATLNARRADVVEQLIAGAADTSDKDMWIRQLIDTVSFAVQSGAYPDGLDRLKLARKKYVGTNRDLAAYLDFQVLGTDYASRLTP